MLKLWSYALAFSKREVWYFTVESTTGPEKSMIFYCRKYKEKSKLLLGSWQKIG